MNLGSCTLLGLILDEKFLFLDAVALPGSTERPFKNYYYFFFGWGEPAASVLLSQEYFFFSQGVFFFFLL